MMDDRFINERNLSDVVRSIRELERKAEAFDALRDEFIRGVVFSDAHDDFRGRLLFGASVNAHVIHKMVGPQPTRETIFSTARQVLTRLFDREIDKLIMERRERPK